jgi:hypothetical protein
MVEVVVLLEAETVLMVVVVVEGADACILSVLSRDGARSFPTLVRALPADVAAASSSEESPLRVISIREFE